MRLMTITEAEHTDVFGQVIWRASNLKNIFHSNGEEFFLKTLFGGQGVPGSYYVGLDARPSLNKGDISSGLTGEPSGNGYLRQSVPPNGFDVSNVNSQWRAKSPSVIFNASGSGWGPVQNAFLTTGVSNTGLLVASVPLQTSRILTAGQFISFRFVLALEN